MRIITRRQAVVNGVCRCMSLRFYRRIRIAPGVRPNLGLHGAGLSVGPRGLHVGVNRRGM
jgi:hypothetical protein